MSTDRNLDDSRARFVTPAEMEAYPRRRQAPRFVAFGALCGFAAMGIFSIQAIAYRRRYDDEYVRGSEAMVWSLCGPLTADDEPDVLQQKARQMLADIRLKRYPIRERLRRLARVLARPLRTRPHG